MKKKFLSKLLICSLIMQSVFLFSDTTYFLNNTHVSAAITGKSPFTSSTYTHNNIFKNYNIYNGIDVSKYNGDINWDKVKKDGDRKSTRLNSSHWNKSRMPSSA